MTVLEKHSSNYSGSQLLALVALRLLIGWHLLYEGAAKLISPGWSSKSFLLDSKGFFAGFFNWIAGSQTLLTIADHANIWGLTLFGLALMLGVFTRISSLGAIVLLALYYLSHPPLIGVEYMFPSEGSYFLVNKNLVEIFALLVLYLFPTSRQFGLCRFWRNDLCE